MTVHRCVVTVSSPDRSRPLITTRFNQSSKQCDNSSRMVALSIQCHCTRQSAAAMASRPTTFKPNRVRQSSLAKVGDRDRGTTTERGYDAAWERCRALHLKSEPFCRKCRPRLVLGSDVDHIITIRNRPDLRLDGDNLQTLCHSHHSQKTRAEQIEASRLMTVEAVATDHRATHVDRKTPSTVRVPRR